MLHKRVVNVASPKVIRLELTPAYQSITPTPAARASHMCSTTATQHYAKSQVCSTTTHVHTTSRTTSKHRPAHTTFTHNDLTSSNNNRISEPRLDTGRAYKTDTRMATRKNNPRSADRSTLSKWSTALLLGVRTNESHRSLLLLEGAYTCGMIGANAKAGVASLHVCAYWSLGWGALTGNALQEVCECV